MDRLLESLCIANLYSLIFVNKSRLLFSFVGLFAFIFYLIVSGQALAASDLDILDRQRDQNRPMPRSQPKMILGEEAPSADMGESFYFTLSSLHLDGATAFMAEELLRPYRRLFGSRVSLGQIYDIAAELTKQYRQAGYLLSRVIIPEQQVEQAGAEIRLLAVEGFIESIQYTGDSRILERFKAYFAPAEKDLLGQKPLKHSVFERQLLLIQDLPGLEVSSRFEKGRAPGGSILVLDLRGDLVQGSLSWGNTGTDASGPGILSAGLALNSLGVLGGKTSFNYAQANDYRQYLSAQFAQSYQFLNGLSLSVSYAYSDSPEMDTYFARTFDYTSQSHTVNLGLSYPFIRSRDLNLSASLNYEHRNSDSDIDGRRFTQDRLRTLSAAVQFDFSDVLGGLTQIIPTLSRGLNIFSATDEALDASNSLAPADFWRFGLYVSRNQRLPRQFSLFTAAEAQFSDASLASYNKFFLGGSRFGCGYEPGVIEGDNGLAFSAEPRWTHYLTNTAALQLFSFIDWGAVWTNKSVWGLPDRQTVSSVGGGVRFWGHLGHESWPDFNLSAFIGQPLESAGGESSDDPRFVVHCALFF